MGWGALIGGGLGLGASYLAKKKQDKANEQAQSILSQSQTALGIGAQMQAAEIEAGRAATQQRVAQIGSQVSQVQKRLLKGLGPAGNPNKLPGLGTEDYKPAPFSGGSKSIFLGGY